jgi:dipeptidyl aminopeptidase/acylaminoacyl peptidase
MKDNTRMSRALTSEDLYAFRLVEEARISPDGTTIAYVQQEMDRASYEYRRSIWLVPANGTEGGEPRRFTAGHNDTAPRWSPDGRYLAFVRAPAGQEKPKNKEERDRGKGKPQLWVIPVAGGEAQQLTRLRHGAGEPTWAPDSRTLAFSARTGTPDDEESDNLSLDGLNVPKVRTIEQLAYKLDGAGYTYELRAHLFTVCVECALKGEPGGDPKQVTDGDWHDATPSWAPDGKRLAFLSDRSDDRFRWPAASLWTIDLTSGAQRRLTSEDLGAHSPSWSPDGRTIAFLAGPRRHGVGHTDLYTVAAESGQPGTERSLTQEFTPTCADTCIDDMRSSHGEAHLTWSPDSAEIFFLASMRGTTHVYAARPRTNRLPRRLTDGKCRVYSYSFDRDGRTMALALSDPAVPGDLYSQPYLAGDASVTPIAPKRLTDLNRQLLSEVRLATPAEFEFRGADDWGLHGWILRPTDAQPGEKLPAILEIHGGPASMYGYAFFMEFQLLVGQGYTVVYSNPRGSTGYGRVFSGAVIGDWGDKDYQDILAGLDAAIERGGIDPSRLGVAGGSYGGYMTNWIVGHNDRFKAAVTMRSVVTTEAFFGTSDIGWWFEDELGVVPWRDPQRARRFAPIASVENIHTPLLILHSDQDLRCPVSEGELLFTALKFLRRETKFVRFEGQSHDLSRGGHPRSRVIRYGEILGWFAKYNPA